MIHREDLRGLVRENPGQGSVDEYEAILEAIRERAPCNVLVFGVGRDSEYWIRANSGGRTVFLEDDPDWIRVAREHNPGARIHRVSYGTWRFLWWWYLRRPKGLFMDDLPAAVLNTEWDVIFVDSPQGQSWKRPGRMKSIYTASRLARRSDQDVHVLVHDCDRKVERICSDAFFGDELLIRQVDSLRHYLVPPESS